MQPGDDDIEIMDQNNNEDEATKNPHDKSFEILPAYSSMEDQNVKEVKVLLFKDNVAVKIFTMDVPFLCNELDIITTIFSKNQVLKDELGYKLIEDDNTERRIVMSAVNNPNCNYHYTVKLQFPSVAQIQVVSYDECHVIENNEDGTPQENPPKCSTPESTDSQETYFEAGENVETNQHDHENFYSCLNEENDIEVIENREKNDENCDVLFAILSQDKYVEGKHLRQHDEKFVAETQNAKNANEIETSKFYSSTTPKGTRSLSQKTIELSDSPILCTSRSTGTPKSQRNSILAVYPPPPTRGGITIYQDNYKCLGDGEYLNDVIIDFYLKYLMNEVVSEEDRNKTHVFSSQFYTRLSKPLVTRSEEKVVMPESEKRHLGVRRWTKNVNIFEKDFIIIPVNEHQHWYLAIICFPGLVGLINDYTESLIRPCILYFDSLSSKNKDRITTILREYLNQEYFAKMGEKRTFSNAVLKVRYPQVPTQSNATDCGLYVLQYVEQFFKYPIEDFTLKCFELSQWFSRQVVKRKRAEIASIVAELAKNYNPGKKVLMPTLQFPLDNVLSDEEDLDSHLEQRQNRFHRDKLPSFAITRKLPENAKSCSLAVLKKQTSEQSHFDEWIREEPSSSSDQHNLSMDFVTARNEVDENGRLIDAEEDNIWISHDISHTKKDKLFESDSQLHKESSFFSKVPKQYRNVHGIGIIKEDFSGAKSHIFEKSSIFSNGTGERFLGGVRSKREYIAKPKSKQMMELQTKFQERKKKNELKKASQDKEVKTTNNKWIDDSDFRPNGPVDVYSVYSVNDEPGIFPSTSYNNYKKQKKYHDQLMQY